MKSILEMRLTEMKRRDFFKGLIALGTGWQILPMVDFLPALEERFKAKVTPVVCQSWELLPIETCSILDESGIVRGILVTGEQEIRATVFSDLPIVPGEVLDLISTSNCKLPRVLVLATRLNDRIGETDIVGMYWPGDGK